MFVHFNNSKFRNVWIPVRLSEVMLKVRTFLTGVGLRQIHLQTHEMLEVDSRKGKFSR